MVSEWGWGPRRWLALGLAVAAVAVVVGGGCSSGGDDDDTAESSPTPEPPFAVGRRTMDLVDDSRPTDAYPPASIDAAPDRTIETVLVYPAAGDPGGAEARSNGERGDGVESVEAPGSTEDAPPAEGSFPLVVWAHGWNGRGDVFLPYAELWAREGYVVALPTFPLSREGVADGEDVQNQPGDVSFVIDQVLDLDIADPDHIAVAGHSLGSATVFGVVYNSCCADDRIDAAIAVSGGGPIFEGGDYENPPRTPLLLVHGARDPGVPIGVGDATFRNQPGPVTYLRFDEADHNNLFWGPDGELFETAVLAFLDDQLRGDPTGMEALSDEVRSSGRATLQAK
jgi:pimeloyl-ACP methyl ester carboxylesterase